MKQRKEYQKNFMQSQSGVTMMELLAVISILSLLCVLAIPTFAAWREDTACRETAHSIFMLLREARSNAIAMNREHRVEFENASRRYGMRSGDRPADTNWPSVPPVKCWATCGPEVHFNSNVRSVQFNTNGTANGGTITVLNGSMEKKFDVIINRTGRIRVQRSS